MGKLGRKSFFLASFSIIAIIVVGVVLLSNSKPVPGNCRIVEQKHCALLRVIDFPNTDFKIIAGKLPQDAYVFNPVNGESQWGKMPIGNTSYPARIVSVPSKERPEIAHYVYNIAFTTADQSYFTNTPTSVKEKEIVGKISDIKMGEFGDYNLIVVVHDQTSKDASIRKADSEKLLRQVFGL